MREVSDELGKSKGNMKCFEVNNKIVNKIAQFEETSRPNKS